MRLLSTLFLLLTSTAAFAAVDIVSVSRDLFHPDIFSYKRKLIGDPIVNKFDFENKFIDDEILPEMFVVKIKSDRNEKGRNVRVVFSFKTDQSATFEEKSTDLILDRHTRKIKFHFSKQDIEAKGRVDLWEVKVFEGNKLIASYRSLNNKWWRES